MFSSTERSPATEDSTYFFGVFFKKGSSQPQISYLYRGDSRAPEQVFNQGFSARGTRTNILEHVNGIRGESIVDSGYVATSISKEIASGFPKEFEGHGFVYEINSPKNAIHIEKALLPYVEKGQLGLEDFEIYAREQEMAIPSKIKSRNIRGAWPVEIKSIQIEDGILPDFERVSVLKDEFILNPSYRTPGSLLLKTVKIAGRSATAVSAGLDAASLWEAYQVSKDEGHYDAFFTESARVTGGWSGAVALGKAGVVACAPIPYGPLVCGLAGSVVGYLGGSELAKMGYTQASNGPDEVYTVSACEMPVQSNQAKALSERIPKSINAISDSICDGVNHIVDAILPNRLAAAELSSAQDADEREHTPDASHAHAEDGLGQVMHETANLLGTMEHAAHSGGVHLPSIVGKVEKTCHVTSKALHASSTVEDKVCAIAGGLTEVVVGVGVAAALVPVELPSAVGIGGLLLAEAAVLDAGALVATGAAVQSTVDAFVTPVGVAVESSCHNAFENNRQFYAANPPQKLATLGDALQAINPTEQERRRENTFHDSFYGKPVNYGQLTEQIKKTPQSLPDPQSDMTKALRALEPSNPVTDERFVIKKTAPAQTPSVTPKDTAPKTYPTISTMKELGQAMVPAQDSQDGDDDEMTFEEWKKKRDVTKTSSSSTSQLSSAVDYNPQSSGLALANAASTLLKQSITSSHSSFFELSASSRRNEQIRSMPLSARTSCPASSPPITPIDFSARQASFNQIVAKGVHTPTRPSAAQTFFNPPLSYGIPGATSNAPVVTAPNSVMSGLSDSSSHKVMTIEITQPGSVTYADGTTKCLLPKTSHSITRNNESCRFKITGSNGPSCLTWDGNGKPMATSLQ